MTIDLRVVEEHQPVHNWVELVDHIYTLCLKVAGEIEIPPVDLTVVLTGNMTASVRGRSRAERDFHPERLGGRVAGKTLDIKRDYSEVAILVAVTDPPADELDAAIQLLDLVTTLGHEYGHMLHGRLRNAAGTRPPATTRRQSFPEMAALIAVIAAEEYRCDLFAAETLKQIGIRVGINGGEPVAQTLSSLRGNGYSDSLREVVDSHVHPGWPDLVDAYRHRRMSLDAMAERLVRETEEVLVLIAHAEAVASSGGMPAVLPTLIEHRGVQLYLGQVWTAIQGVLDRTGPIPSTADFAMADKALLECGDVIEKMWKDVGLTGSMTEDGGLYIQVDQPNR